MKERLVDRLLYSIIDAYEPAEETESRETRLAAVKRALFGIKPKPGRPTLDDGPAVLEVLNKKAHQDLSGVRFINSSGECYHEIPRVEEKKTDIQLARDATNKKKLL